MEPLSVIVELLPSATVSTMATVVLVLCFDRCSRCQALRLPGFLPVGQPDAVACGWFCFRIPLCMPPAIGRCLHSGTWSADWLAYPAVQAVPILWGFPPIPGSGGTQFPPPLPVPGPGAVSTASTLHGPGSTPGRKCLL